MGFAGVGGAGGARTGVAEDAVDAADAGDGGGVAHALCQQLLPDLPGKNGWRLLLEVQNLTHHLWCRHLLPET